MKFSIKSILIFSFSVIMLTTLFLIIISSYYSSKNIMSQHNAEIMDSISSFAVDKSQHYMEIASKATKLTKELKSNSVINNDDSKIMMKYFHEQIKINDHFLALYYAASNGEFYMLLKNDKGYMEKTIVYKNKQKIVKKLTYNSETNKTDIVFDNSDTYNPLVRPWYVQAIKSKELIWTDPYVFFTSKKPGITTAVPVYEKDVLKGVIGIDIELDNLSNFINKLKISENGKVFMMDTSLNMMSFPIKKTDTINQKPRLLKLDELDNNIVKKAYAELSKTTDIKTFSKKVLLNFEYNNENYTAMFFPSSKNGITWIIGMYAPENDYLGLIKKNQELNILLIISIGLISILLIYKIAGLISKPIGRLENMAHELKKINLEVEAIELSPITEINEAIESFNTMKDSLKINEQMLKKLNTTLEEKVQEKTSELKELNDKLEEKIEERIIEIKKKDKLLVQQTKMAAMGEMLNSISHQWRQPLSIISTAATGVKLQKEMNVLTDSDFNNTMDSINDATQYLSQTIEDFRDFVDQRNNKINKVLISETVDKTLKLVSAQLLSSKIEIIKNIEDVSIISIENELIQVIINILNNSKDALLELKDEKRLIFINTYKSNNDIVLEIKDNAKGISKDIITRVFEPYFTTKHQSQGTGIGLYMSHDIIVNHLNGTISVSNETYIYEGISYNGAKFTIVLENL